MPSRPTKADVENSNKVLRSRLNSARSEVDSAIESNKNLMKELRAADAALESFRKCVDKEREVKAEMRLEMNLQESTIRDQGGMIKSFQTGLRIISSLQAKMELLEKKT